MLALKAHASGMLLALVASVIVPPGARAQSVYDALFGSPAQRAPQLEYAPAPFIQPFFEVERAPARRRVRAQSDRDMSETPTPPPVMPATAKAPRVTPDKELVASIMADRTLRKGDIVVFPDGPRVYRGSGDLSNKPRDFEDLRLSRHVDDKVRKVVLAATRSGDAQLTVADTAKRRPSNRARFEEVAATGSISAGTAR